MTSNIIALNVTCRSAGKIFRLKAITIPPIRQLSAIASESYRDPVKALRGIRRIGAWIIIPDPELRSGWQVSGADHRGVISGPDVARRLWRQRDRHEHFARVGKSDRESIWPVESLALLRSPVHHTPLDDALDQ